MKESLDQHGKRETRRAGARRRRRSIACALAVVVAGVAIIVGARVVCGESVFANVPLFGGAAEAPGAAAGSGPGGSAGDSAESLFGHAGDYEVEATDLAEGEDSQVAQENTRYLQHAIDVVADHGGGTVRIPAGTFRFAAGGSYDEGDYAIEARSDVAIVGAGAGETTLMPVGIWALTGQHRYGVDMFWYDGMDSGTYLSGASFADLTVDGIAARGSFTAYNASGKGFFFKLFRDCTWENVVVKNTDGTGFGIDYPVDCTLTNCTAVSCGKNATEDSVGASGFGIGVGYSDDESILIEDCAAYDNTKYGFFFEHQTLFSNEVAATKAAGFVVRGCVASGNLYNFGGNRAYDVSYESCVSAVSDDARREAYTRHAYMLERNSVRVSFSDCVVEQSCADVDAGDACYEAVRWALSEGIVESGPDDVHAFRPRDRATRREVAFMLWRLAGWPGEVLIGSDAESNAPAADVSADDPCADAVRWLRAEGISVGATFRPDDEVTFGELATLLWRLAGEPEAGGSAPREGVSGSGEGGSDAAGRSGAGGESRARSGTEAPYYAEAAAWAVGAGVLEQIQANLPNATVMRGDAVRALLAYARATGGE